MKDIDKIKNPEVNTYWIIFDEDNIVKTYGIVSPMQVLSTKETKIEMYIDKDEWIKVLESYKIEVE
ncbi:MAG: hypothetical protein CMJ25_21070 [Phycisphaerae bacterium]|jgi:hypothetical protein|nr:hypothetical protein [Phycisphaerae bacterium]|tara:strand:+ start:1349 stop:1546 length:198 start_codon:yes stop_codon:yes gene_type:complete